MEKRKILIYGDSNTYGYDPADFYENRYPADERWTNILQENLGDSWEVLPEGMNGRQLPELKYDKNRIHRLLDRLSGDDLFAVMLGTNDILVTMEPDASEVIRKMQTFLAFLTETEAMDPGNILVIAPPHVAGSRIRHPVYQRFYQLCLQMNEGFHELADSFGTMFTDAGGWNIALAPDLVHFSVEGHRTFAENLTVFLRNRFHSAERT